MFGLIAGILLAILFSLKLLAIQAFATNIVWLQWVNSWFVWIFALLMFIILYASSRKFLMAMIITSVIALIMRFILKI